MGCIPTKSLLHTADVWERFVHSDKEGIACENPRLEYPKVKARKDGIVDKHSKGVAFLLKRAKVEQIAGFATLKGGGKVEVKSDAGVQTLEAKNIIHRHRLGSAHAARYAARCGIHPHQYRNSRISPRFPKA